MKKLIMSGLILATMGVTIISCNKEKVEVESETNTEIHKPDGLSIQDQKAKLVDNNDYSKLDLSKGVVEFKTIEYYKSIIDAKDNENKIYFLSKYINESSFKSFGKINPTSQLFDDDFMEAILDKNKIVKIGRWYVKINPEDESVFVSSSENERAYDLVLNETESNTNVYKFSTGDNILEFLSSQPTDERWSWWCSEDGVGSKHVSSGIMCIDNYCQNELHGEMHFRRFGIYYSLYLKVYKDNGSGYYMSMDLPKVYYHVKCGNTVGSYSVYGYGWETSNFRYQSYQGSTNLNEIWFKGRVKAQKWINGGWTYVNSGWLQIRVNV